MDDLDGQSQFPVPEKIKEGAERLD